MLKDRDLPGGPAEGELAASCSRLAVPGPDAAAAARMRRRFQALASTRQEGWAGGAVPWLPASAFQRFAPVLMAGLIVAVVAVGAVVLLQALSNQSEPATSDQAAENAPAAAGAGADEQPERVDRIPPHQGPENPDATQFAIATIGEPLTPGTSSDAEVTATSPAEEPGAAGESGSPGPEASPPPEASPDTSLVIPDPGSSDEPEQVPTSVSTPEEPPPAVATTEEPPPAAPTAEAPTGGGEAPVPGSEAEGRVDTYTISGVGSIDLLVSGDSLSVIGLVTESGWTAEHYQVAAGEIEVYFSDGVRKVRFWARASGGVVETVVQEG